MRRAFLSLYSLIVVAVIAVGWGLDKVWQSHAPGETVLAGEKQLVDLFEYLLQQTPPNKQQELLENINRDTGLELSLHQVGDFSNTKLFEKMMSGAPVVVDTGEARLFYRKLNNSDHIIGIRQPVDGHSHPVTYNLLLLFFYLAIALVIFLWIWPLSRDLNKLEKQTKLLGSEVVPEDLSIAPTSAVHDLASAFNRMSRRVRDLLASHKEMTYAVSHELRTPLTSILGYTDLAAELLEDLPAEDSRDLVEFLAVIERNAERLLVRVEDLLLQQQTQYGTLKLEKRNVSLAELAREAAQAQRAVAADKGIDFTFEILGEPQLRVDPRRITQVIDNILSNALKYTPSGGEVTMCVQSIEGTGVAVPEAVLSVTDTGPGLTPEEIEQVFTPFFRTQSASQYAEGTGLGLSVTKGIVEAHHGRVHVESQPGEGSTFSVYLPLREEYML